MKKLFTTLVLCVFIVSLLTAAAPFPNAAITVGQGLPETMRVGEEFTVVVNVTSDQEFISATAQPSFQYPGKGVVAIQAGDRSGRGTSATLAVTFKAKSTTERMEGGIAPVHVFVGVRYAGGYTVMEDHIFYVKVQ
jgi:hypothetical protein